jgi:hypothetical protein
MVGLTCTFGTKWETSVFKRSKNVQEEVELVDPRTFEQRTVKIYNAIDCKIQFSGNKSDSLLLTSSSRVIVSTAEG